MSSSHKRATKLAKLKSKKPQLYYMQPKDIAVLRKILLRKQKNICPLCFEYILESDAVLDHKHKRHKAEELGKDGAGLCRAVLHSYCNTAEGTIVKVYRRRGLENKGVNISTYLRGLAELYESKPYSEKRNGVPIEFVHPTEVPKKKTLSKRNYGKVKTQYKKNPCSRGVFPEYPRSSKPTVKLIALFEHYQIPLYN